MTTDIVRFKDFTPDHEDPPTFKVYANTYVCIPDIPIDALAAISSWNDEGLTTDAKMKMMVDFFADIMRPESATLFRESVKRGAENPIGVKTINQLVPWLLEVYGLRPTPESSESSDGSTDDDGSSTDGA